MFKSSVVLKKMWELFKERVLSDGKTSMEIKHVPKSLYLCYNLYKAYKITEKTNLRISTSIKCDIKKFKISAILENWGNE